jgi:tetratricopeptide (TPR) repeat protein
MYLQRIEEAMTCIEQGIEKEPDNSECHYMKGKALLLCYEIEEAINSFENSIRINPDSAESYFHMS